MKNWFQNSPFKCNLQRYTEALGVPLLPTPKVFHESYTLLGHTRSLTAVVGRCRLNQVDP